MPSQFADRSKVLGSSSEVDGFRVQFRYRLLVQGRHLAETPHFLDKNGIGAPVRRAYLIHREAKRNLVDDGILLIGDAAGLAYSQSGEGILPAIESGLLAAKAILEADGKYNHERLNSYCELLASRFGDSKDDWTTRIGRTLPQQGMQFLARMLLRTRWFPRHVVLDRWFLRIR
ncbi:MAG: NAD(P)/FAD-dependent oxidoreductase [Terracidiphilus sp.]